MDDRTSDEEKKPPVTPPENEPVEPGDSNFVDELRHNLSEEEKTHKPSEGGLLKRLTGILRRPKSGPLPPAEPSLPPAGSPEETITPPEPAMEPEVLPESALAEPETFLSGDTPALFESEPEEPSPLAAEQQPPALFDSEEDTAELTADEPPALFESEPAPTPLFDAEEDDPFSRPESAAFFAEELRANPDELMDSPASAALFDESDAASRSADNAGLRTEPPATTPTNRPRGLRGFITGMLHLPEARSEEPDSGIDDSILTSRLQRSLGQGAEAGESAPPQLESGHEPPSFSTANLDDADTPDWDRLNLGGGESAPPQARPLKFGDIELELEEEPPAEIESPLAEPAGSTEPVAEGDLFAEEEVDLESAQIAETKAFLERLSAMDEVDTTSVYWAGRNTESTPPAEGGVSGRASDETMAIMDEMRSQLIDSYGETPAAIKEDPEEVAARRQRRRKTALRVGLMVLFGIVIGLIGAFALFYSQLPVQQVAQVIMVRPTGLPASGAQLPTGMELTGGWYFPVERNTLIDGQWKPQAAEWLEGSELPRVVAIPWNSQTEAVIQTFKPGDPIVMHFSDKAITYKVSEVKRVAVSDTSIFQNRKPTLVVVLYEEDSDERWVVICN